jgi:hypothetical protein
MGCTAQPGPTNIDVAAPVQVGDTDAYWTGGPAHPSPYSVRRTRAGHVRETGTKFGLHTRGGQSHYFGTELLDHDFGFRQAASKIAHALHLAGYTVTLTKDALTVLDDAAKGSLRPARIDDADRDWPGWVVDWFSCSRVNGDLPPIEVTGSIPVSPTKNHYMWGS